MIFVRNQKYKNILILISSISLLIGGSIYFTIKQQHSPEPSRIGEDGQIISGSFDPAKQKTDEYWKKILTSEQYHILREAGTEIPFTGELNNEKRTGTYFSVGCDIPISRSEQKYQSGTGWPSFWAPINDDALVLRKEDGIGDDRIEVLDTCGNHLGHVFYDGPEPTGKRYCMNSRALRFVPDNE